MNEQLSAEKQTKKVSPRDLANAALRRKGTEVEEHQAETRAKAGDIFERDGVEGMFVPLLRSTKKIVEGKFVEVRVPYTYRQYYSHSFEDPNTGRWEAAPGWDSKFALMDEEMTLSKHGRTFSQQELSDLPSNLPDDDALFAEPTDSYEVEEYLDTLEN